MLVKYDLVKYDLVKYDLVKYDLVQQILWHFYFPDFLAFPTGEKVDQKKLISCIPSRVR